jgi:AraC-like DNA-binding protein
VAGVGVDHAASYRAGRPAAALRGLVDVYVGYDIVGPPGVHRGLPSRHVTFVVALEEITVTAPDAGGGTLTAAALVGGMHDRPALITHSGVQTGVQLGVTPAGARALFGLPAGELAGLVVPLDAVLPRAAELADRLATARRWPERFAAVDEVLLGAVRDRSGRGVAGSPEVGHAWRRLQAASGAASVTALAGEVGWSRRHLAERFRREIGLPPKVGARVLRFARARTELLRPGPAGTAPRLADVAVACGYADQAHLTREWRDLAGCTPSAWLAEEAPWLRGPSSGRTDEDLPIGQDLPFVQDAGRLPAAG